MSIDEQGFLSLDIAEYIAKHRAENQVWFGHAMDLNSIAQQLLLEFEVKDNQTLFAALLYVRGLSSFQAAVLLVERGMVQDARTIVRSCFETLFCFSALRKDPGFLDKFEKHDVYGKRVFADNLRKERLEPDTAEILSRFIEGLARSGEKGQRLNWKDVAHWAGLDAIYNVYYRGLSGDAAHPSSTALKRYYKVDGNNVELQFGPKALDQKDIEETLIASCAACWPLVAGMAECVNHPEINEKSRLCSEEFKRLIEAARAAAARA
jgi:Family of unknown function (DUF5677)